MTIEMEPPTQMNTTILSTLVHDMAVYNQWANQTLVDYLRQKPEELLHQEVASSFPGLKATIEHIWDTQRFWLCVIQKTTPPTSFRFEPFQGTAEEAFEGLMENSKALTTFIQTLDDAGLQEPVSFDSPWVKGTQARFEFIHQVLNHSTYHRGQVVTIGRQLGFTDAPMTDYNFYLMMVKGK